MNVLVYAGAGVVQASLSHTTAVLRSLLTPHYSVQLLSTQAFESQPWSQNCALLVLPQHKTIPNLLLSSRSLKAFVGNGGYLLGFGYSLDVTSTRSQDLGDSIRFFDSATNLTTIVNLAASQTVPAAKGTNVEVLEQLETGEPCAVKVRVGHGQILAWSTNPEIPSSPESGEKSREQIGNTLSALGLKTSDESSRTTQPLPQFLVAAESAEDATSQALGSLKLSLTSSTEPPVFKDDNDTFTFHDAQTSSEIMQTSRANIAADTEIPKEKHVIVFPSGRFPNTFTTPLFDLQRYFSVMQENGAKTSIGKLVLYSEVVTSTQTMLDR